MSGEELRNHLNLFTYTAIAGKDYITDLKSQEAFLSQSIKTEGLIEKRAYQNLGEKEQYRINTERYSKLFSLIQRIRNPDQHFRNSDYISVTSGLTLNTQAFLVAIELLGNPEQVKYWQNQVLSGKVIGSYGQTELGHGSNVQGIETTATYNLQKQTFLINSPTLTSGKFWPGVLGLCGTHTVLQAKTFVNGKSLGVQTFVVELRDKNLNNLVNVEAFDIGPKLGFERVDNGSLFLKNLQIPRDSLLMRYVKVQPNGDVEGLQNKEAIKYGYGSMLNLRVVLTYMFAFTHTTVPAMALAMVLKEMNVQNQLSHKKAYIQPLCVGLGMVISNIYTKNIFNKFLVDLKKEDYSQADKHLINCHIISSTFKAVSSWISIDLGAKLMNQTKNGVFRTSVIPNALFNAIPSATYEGDNSVLLQQTAKFLMMKYQGDANLVKPDSKLSTDDWSKAITVLEYIINYQIAENKKRIEKHSEKGIQFQEIWNEKEQVSLIQTSILWGKMMFLKGLLLTMKDITEHKQFYNKIAKVFSNYLLKTITHLQFYGFELIENEAWRQFTSEQQHALVNINAPIYRQIQPMRYFERNETNWMQAKL